MTRFRALPLLVFGLLAFGLSGCVGYNAFDAISGWQSGICGLLYAIAVVYAFVQIANSRRDTGTKVLWAIIVFVAPVFGLILWYFMGPRDR